MFSQECSIFSKTWKYKFCFATLRRVGAGQDMPAPSCETQGKSLHFGGRKFLHLLRAVLIPSSFVPSLQSGGEGEERLGLRVL